MLRHPSWILLNFEDELWSSETVWELSSLSSALNSWGRAPDEVQYLTCHACSSRIIGSVHILILKTFLSVIRWGLVENRDTHPSFPPSCSLWTNEENSKIRPMDIIKLDLLIEECMLIIVVELLKQRSSGYWLSPACHPGSVVGQSSSFILMKTGQITTKSMVQDW